MVYILDTDGQPLMPTTRHGHVRKLLDSHKAKVIRRCPFTVQLLYSSTRYTQPVTAGIDAGSKAIGISACTEKEELYSAELTIRNDITKLMTARREFRRARRNRKTRYRKPRFLNRIHGKKPGWLAPSVKAKADNHLTAIKKLRNILPVSKVVIEMAPFDTQLLKAQMAGTAPQEGTDYQHGEATGYDNIKAYVKWRDGYQCVVCHGKEHLQVHHKHQRKDGGSNMPSNLVTVCEKCHAAYHAQMLPKAKAKRLEPDIKIRPMRDAAFMSQMRWYVYDTLKASGIPVTMTFGYITAKQREKYNLSKAHRIDARCIAGYGNAAPAAEWFAQRKVRCHNRQMHKSTILKGGIRKRNQAEHTVKGFRLFDKVRYAGQEWFVTGRRTKGSFVLTRGADGRAEVTPMKITFVETAHNTITERRPA